MVKQQAGRLEDVFTEEHFHYTNIMPNIASGIAKARRNFAITRRDAWLTRMSPDSITIATLNVAEMMNS